MENILNDLKGFTISEKIGSGSYSTVYKAYETGTEGRPVAIKVFSRNKLSFSRAESIFSEISIMRTLSHPHIVTMVDFQWSDTFIYLVLEYCDGGDLSHFIKKRKQLPERVCKKFMQQLALGMSFLHTKGICHMDLKPQNLLLVTKPVLTLKIGDFGLAQHLSEVVFAEAIKGSPLYMAPEILLKKKYNNKVDLWSIGIILYECLFGKAPFAHKNCKELIECLKRQVPIKIDEPVAVEYCIAQTALLNLQLSLEEYPSKPPLSDECKELLNGLLEYDPEQRISYEEFFHDPFLDLQHYPSRENFNLGVQILHEALKHDEKGQFVQAFNTYCRCLRYLVPYCTSLPDNSVRLDLRKRIDAIINRAESLRTVFYYSGSKHESIDPHWSPSEELAERELRALRLDSASSSAITSSIPSPSTSAGSCLSAKQQERDGGALSQQWSELLTSWSRMSGDKGAEGVNLVDSPSYRKKSRAPSGNHSMASVNSLYSQEDYPHTLKDLCKSTPKVVDALDIGYSAEMYLAELNYKTAYEMYISSLNTLIPHLKKEPPGLRRNLLHQQILRWLKEAESTKTMLGMNKNSLELEFYANTAEECAKEICVVM